LSDRTRLRILNFLRGGERCVCELVSVLDAPQPTVSRHLAYLRRAGLVRARKEGLWHYYRLMPAASAFHGRLLECLATLPDEDRELRNDARRLRSAAPPCCE
jgi:ArsR family transcriptional regulator